MHVSTTVNYKELTLVFSTYSEILEITRHLNEVQVGSLHSLSIVKLDIHVSEILIAKASSLTRAARVPQC